MTDERTIGSAGDFGAVGPEIRINYSVPVIRSVRRRNFWKQGVRAMRRVFVCGMALSAAVLGTSVCFAVWIVSNTGDWPQSWPTQLEPLRSQSRTFRHDRYTMYHIPFSDREQFEAAWPHILSIASEGSPLTLSCGHDRFTAIDFDAGVVIFTPNTGQLIAFGDKEMTVYPPCSESSIPDGKFLRVGPPWPDAIRDQSGKLPEYVVADGLEWRATTSQEMRDDIMTAIRSHRARTEIRLIVDGEIVDLNRIQLPVSVVDERFGEKPDP